MKKRSGVRSPLLLPGPTPPNTTECGNQQWIGAQHRENNLQRTWKVKLLSLNQSTPKGRWKLQLARTGRDKNLCFCNLLGTFELRCYCSFKFNNKELTAVVNKELEFYLKDDFLFYINARQTYIHLSYLGVLCTFGWILELSCWWLHFKCLLEPLR